LYGKEPVQQRRLLTVQKITAAIDYKTEHTTQPNRLSDQQWTLLLLRMHTKFNHHELSYHFTENLAVSKLPYCSLKKEKNEQKKVFFSK
jgi:hypothetical protein